MSFVLFKLHQDENDIEQNLFSIVHKQIIIFFCFKHLFFFNFVVLLEIQFLNKIKNSLNQPFTFFSAEILLQFKCETITFNPKIRILGQVKENISEAKPLISAEWMHF